MNFILKDHELFFLEYQIYEDNQKNIRFYYLNLSCRTFYQIKKTSITHCIK
jgi:hypothetical protein